MSTNPEIVKLSAELQALKIEMERIHGGTLSGDIDTLSDRSESTSATPDTPYPNRTLLALSHFADHAIKILEIDSFDHSDARKLWNARGSINSIRKCLLYLDSEAWVPRIVDNKTFEASMALDKSLAVWFKNKVGLEFLTKTGQSDNFRRMIRTNKANIAEWNTKCLEKRQELFRMPLPTLSGDLKLLDFVTNEASDQLRFLGSIEPTNETIKETMLYIKMHLPVLLDLRESITRFEVFKKAITEWSNFTPEKRAAHFEEMITLKKTLLETRYEYFHEEGLEMMFGRSKPRLEESINSLFPLQLTDRREMTKKLLNEQFFGEGGAFVEHLDSLAEAEAEPALSKKRLTHAFFIRLRDACSTDPLIPTDITRIINAPPGGIEESAKIALMSFEIAIGLLPRPDLSTSPT